MLPGIAETGTGTCPANHRPWAGLLPRAWRLWGGMGDAAARGVFSATPVPVRADAGGAAPRAPRATGDGSLRGERHAPGVPSSSISASENACPSLAAVMTQR